MVSVVMLIAVAPICLVSILCFEVSVFDTL
jgi:hypothetical protein